MRRRATRSALVPLACAWALASACVVGNLDLTGKACDGPHPCADGFACVAGLCQLAGAPAPTGTADAGVVDAGEAGSDAGGDAGPPCSSPSTCTADHQGLRLCDGGVQPCGSKEACDFGSCAPTCGAQLACAAGTVCDQSANACVPNPACGGTDCATDQVCVASVCLVSPVVGPGAGEDCPADGDAGFVSISGVVTLFPLADAATSLTDGGTVTFFLGADGGSTPVVVPIVEAPCGANCGVLPGYQTLLPVGTGIALVQGPGVLPTYFPGLEIRPSASGAATLHLESVVSTAFLASPSVPYSPDPSHLVWVGRAAPLGPGCQFEQTYLGGYTVGLSPSPAFTGYFRKNATLSTSLVASDPGIGAFIALDAPYAQTRYAVGIATSSGVTALLSGAFTPPAFISGQTVAVALIYPNFTQ